MNRKVALELRDDNCIYDKDGAMVASTLNMNYNFFECDESDKSKTVELVKLGVTVDEIIKLKSMDLI